MLWGPPSPGRSRRDPVGAYRCEGGVEHGTADGVEDDIEAVSAGVLGDVSSTAVVV